jgi:hypothetical protein
MTDFILILSYRDEADRPVTSVTKISLELVDIESTGSLVDISIFKYAKNYTRDLIQRIILPSSKLNKLEIVDVTSPNCPTEYIELAVKEQMRNGR